jgi:hypothetical protein
LVDFASKTHSQPMVMRDNRSGAISANVELAHLKRKIRCGASFMSSLDSDFVLRAIQSLDWGASRLGQSPLSSSFHFIMLALRPYFSISLRT